MAVIDDKSLLSLLSRACVHKGDFAEIGVFRGDTFKRLALLGQSLGRVSHAFDSFEGMAPATERDAGHYPEGRLSVGGVEQFRTIMNKARISPSCYQLHEGFIPDCFKSYEATKPFAFGLVDVDQYAPTVTALNWLWPLIAYGGILVLDDYFPGRTILASAGIDTWLATINPGTYTILEYNNTQLFIQKQFVTDPDGHAHALIMRDH